MKMKYHWKWVYILLLLILNNARAVSLQDTIRVHKYLNETLHKDIRPVLNQDNTLHVNASLELLKIDYIDAKSQVLSVSLGITMVWNYETLQWNRTQFGNVSSVRLSVNNVWLPGIIINAIGNSYEFFNSDIMKVTVYYNGSAYWWSAGNFDISCDINIRNYPFDTQVCAINVSNSYAPDYFQTLHRPCNTMGLPFMMKMTNGNFLKHQQS